MKNEIIQLSIIVFVTQIVFIGARTYNVKCISKGNIWGAVISGVFIHLAWLASVAIGVESVTEIVKNFDYQYVPVIFASTLGGSYGTYLALKKKNPHSKKE